MTVRNVLLGEITGIAGDVFKELEGKGIEIGHRETIAFCEVFSRMWLALPEPAIAAKARLVSEALDHDERHDGGLVNRDTLPLNMALMQELGR